MRRTCSICSNKCCGSGPNGSFPNSPLLHSSEGVAYSVFGTDVFREGFLRGHFLESHFGALLIARSLSWVSNATGLSQPGAVTFD